MLCLELRAFGIDCDGDPASVGVIGIERDADLAIIRQLDDIPLLALVPSDRSVENGQRVVEAIELGVAAVLPVGTPPSRIAEVLHLLARGDRGDDALHAFAGELLMLGVRARGEAKAKYAITRRERQVLELVVKGHTTPDIATYLGIGFHTANTHVRNLFRKLEVGSRAAAASLAVRHQLV